MAEPLNEKFFAREYWTGDSRDGHLVNGDGYHYYEMREDGKIIDAYEMYENDDGTEVVSPLPEMRNISWKRDLGFEDWEVLDFIKRHEFERIKSMTCRDS